MRYDLWMWMCSFLACALSPFLLTIWPLSHFSDQLNTSYFFPCFHVTIDEREGMERIRVTATATATMLYCDAFVRIPSTSTCRDRHIQKVTLLPPARAECMREHEIGRGRKEGRSKKDKRCRCVHQRE